MLKLQELLHAKTIKPNEWMENKLPLHLIFTNTGPLATNFIYNLMFRIEGMVVGDKPVTVHILDDGSKVRKQDIKLGLYVNKDLGKNRADVLLKRYGSVFTTPIIKQIEMKQMITDLRGTNKNNIVVLGFEKNFELSTKLFNQFIVRTKGGTSVNSREKSKEAETYGSVARVHGVSEEDTLTVINTVYRKYGDVIGEVDIDEKKSTKKSIQNIVIQNQMIGQMMLNCLNLLITEDESMQGLPYLTWNYNMETGKQHNKRNTKELTIFHKQYLYRKLIDKKVTPEQLEKFSRDFEEQRPNVEKELKEKEIRHSKLEIKSIVTTMASGWIRVLTVNLSQKRKKNLFQSELEEYQQKEIVLALLEEERNKIAYQNEVKRPIILMYQLIKYIEERGWKMTDF